jgi:hypothetical protein
MAPQPKTLKGKAKAPSPPGAGSAEPIQPQSDVESNTSFQDELQQQLQRVNERITIQNNQITT